jgi:hypothetical protein
MSGNRKRLMVAAAATAVASLALTSGVVRAADAEPTTQELLEQIKQLQQKVEKLEAKQAEKPAAAAAATTPSNADVARTIDEMNKDAERRSTVLLEPVPFTGNWQAGKFTLRSDDGNFLLHPWFQLQFREVLNYRDGVPPDGGSEWENGFEVRRMKFGVDGNVFSPDTTYLFNWATNRNNGNLVLEEAWLRQKLTDTWAVKAGQIKDPFAHESLVSSKRFMAADRTLLTDVFTGGDNYVQGVAAQYTRDALQAEVAFTDGTNSPNENFEDFPTNNWDFGVAGRVQYKLFGDWSAYEQFSSLNIKKDLAVIGGGVDLSQAGDTNQFMQTVDIQYNQQTGLGLYGAFYGRYTANAPVESGAPATPTSDTFDWGLIAQASYLIPNSKWEPYIRWDFIQFDQASVGGTDDSVNEFTIGTNYYIHGHDLKLTVDVMYLPNGSPVSDTGSGVLVSDDTQFVFRGQFQLLL